MFPQLPEDLTALNDEELATLHDEFQTAGRTLRDAARNRDPEVLGERTQQDVLDELQTGVESLETIRAEQKSRETDEEQFEEQLGELSQKIGDEPAEELAAEGDEPEAAAEAKTEDEPEAEAETASARQITRRPLPLAKRHKPQPPDVDTSGLRSNIRSEALSIAYGDKLERKSLGDLLSHVVKRNVVNPGARVVVASATFDYPEERLLGTRAEDNLDKIHQVVGPQALVASGGLCAPLEPIYDLPGVETAARPVRDALANFQANRGGVIVGATPSMGTYDDAVGHITAADNETGGSLAVKNCMRIECPDFSSVEVDSIYQCIEADNLASRAYPELMARIDTLVRAEQARLADGFLLDRIKAGSTAVTGSTATAGAVFNILGDIFKAAAGYRSRHRMAPGATLNALFPAWVADLLALDIARAAGQTQPVSRDGIDGFLRSKGIAPSFYLDGTSTANPGQVFAAQGASTLVQFPSKVEWFLFAPGTWLHLDAGTLDLGVVRDSTLNSTNDFQIFAETWENVVKVGVESLTILTTVCASGTFAAGKDLSASC